MKYKLKNVKNIKRTLGLVGVCAGVGLALGALSYLRINQQIVLGQQNAEMTEALVEVARVDVLLHEINAGQAVDIKKRLNSELASDLVVVQNLAPSADATRQEFAKLVVDHITRDAKRHPEYYLASSRRAGT